MPTSPTPAHVRKLGQIHLSVLTRRKTGSSIGRCEQMGFLSSQLAQVHTSCTKRWLRWWRCCCLNSTAGKRGSRCVLLLWGERRVSGEGQGRETRDDGTCTLASERASSWPLCGAPLAWPLAVPPAEGRCGRLGLICWELARSSSKRNESCASLNPEKQSFRVLLPEQAIRYGFGVI